MYPVDYVTRLLNCAICCNLLPGLVGPHGEYKVDTVAVSRVTSPPPGMYCIALIISYTTLEAQYWQVGGARFRLGPTEFIQVKPLIPWLLFVPILNG